MKESRFSLNTLDHIVDLALERPKDEQTAFLRRKCGDDLELYTEVVALLEMHAKAESALGDSVIEYAEPLLKAVDESAPATRNAGEDIGPYRLLREIGRGGMGTVFLARRTDDVHHEQVALKLVNTDLAAEFVAHFRSERQILASLNHPGIARLLDGGETEGGRPYLVMEYVDGEPITAYADRNRLTVDQRLELFGKVCDAVAYAHRNLIVHRDLKPSNVLVTEEHGGNRSVKLLDFGIAKLLEGDGESSLTVTVGHRLMTPDYAAPEQIRGEPVTTSTDVYALGGLLYRLLTGHRPYRITSRTRRAVEEAILSAKHIEPSIVVTQTSAWTRADGSTATIVPADVGTERSTDAHRLSRRLKGDLDTIVLKALRKEPERRYGTAEALGRDIGRHRMGLPVEARPDRLGYRIHKFIRRHRVGVAASLLIFAALLLGFGLTYWQSQERAQEAARADMARDFALSLLGLADPDQSRGAPVTTEDLLDQGSKRALEELREEPDVQEEILLALAGINNRLSRNEEARDLYAYVLAQRTARFKSGDPGVAEAQVGLAAIAMYTGETAKADSLFTAALPVMRRQNDPLLLARTLYVYGVLARQQNDLGGAEARHREALSLRRRHAGQESQDVAESLKSLALVQHQRNALDEAEPLYREALVLQVRLSGEFHPDVGSICNSLASLFRTQGRYEEADSLYRRALAVYRQIYPGDSRYLVTALAQWSKLQVERGRPEDAETSATEAVAMARRLFGESHPSVALASNSLALALAEQERYAEAAVMQEHVVAMYEAGPGPDHPFTAIALQSLAKSRLEAGEIETAAALFGRALSIQDGVLEDGNPNLAETFLGLGRVALAQGRTADGEARIREALAIHEAQFGPDHPHTAEAQSWLGASLLRQGRLAEAAPLIETSARFLEREARRSIRRALRSNQSALQAERTG